MGALQLGPYANQEHLYKSHSSFGPIYASIWLLLYFYSSQVPSVLVPLGDIRPGSCYMLQHIQFDSSTRRWRTAEILLQTSKRESCDITSHLHDLHHQHRKIRRHVRIQALLNWALMSLLCGSNVLSPVSARWVDVFSVKQTFIIYSSWFKNTK